MRCALLLLLYLLEVDGLYNGFYAIDTIFYLIDHCSDIWLNIKMATFLISIDTKGSVMKELNVAETHLVSGAASTGLLDSIGGAITGMIAGAMGVAWSCYNISANTDGVTSGILAPAQAVLGGLFGGIWGAVFGLVVGAAEGTTDSLARADSVWNNIIAAG